MDWEPDDVLKRPEVGVSMPADRGASAILLAFAMVLLLGVAAVALDLSAGFNERNQDQTAGDNGVMAGAIEKAVANPDNQLIVNNALRIAQANLSAQFPGGMTDPAWIAMWRGCVDTGNPGWISLPEPAAWGGSGTLDCISQTTSLLRVRIPDQLLPTTFGAVLGANTITTNAVSIAKVALMGGAPPVVPFGIASGAGAGEYCLSTAPAGNAFPPCAGSQTGQFGSIISPFFADFGTHDPVCNGNTGDWFERNLIWGLDHRVHVFGGASAIPPGSAWPGTSAITALAGAHQDECKLDPDGNATPLDGIPINTIRADSGFPIDEMTNGLVSDVALTTWGRAARLQQPTPATRPLYNSGTAWDVDNVGPWMFLTEAGTHPTCKKSHYATLSDTLAKVDAFEDCIANAGADEIFDSNITSSPRFVWAPEYVYKLGTGTHWNPVRKFRPMYLGGVWLNCPNPASGKDCGVHAFYPDEAVTGPLCDGTYPTCKKVKVNQLSTWLLPETSLPTSVFDDFDDAFTNLEAELFQ